MSNEFTPYAIVADDDALIRMDATDILEDAGFRTHEACTVEDVIKLLEAAAESVQLLFSDVRMPPSERNGFDLAREVDKRWPHIQILIASGEAKPQGGDLPERARFINKPFSADVVHNHLDEILPDGQKPEPLKRRAR